MKLLMITIVGLAACSDGGGVTTNTFDVPVQGSLVAVGGGTIPGSGVALGLWIADDGTGDYVYKYGTGTSTGAALDFGIDEPLPEAAKFPAPFGLGVGLIGLFAAGTSVPDGRVVDDAGLFDMVLGYSGEYAIIFKTNDVSEAPWLTAFPLGLSCGKCVHEVDGFDGFAPVDCSEVVVEVGPESAIMGCNWT